MKKEMPIAAVFGLVDSLVKNHKLKPFWLMFKLMYLDGDQYASPALVEDCKALLDNSRAIKPMSEELAHKYEQALAELDDEDSGS